MKKEFVMLNKREKIIQKCIAIAGWHSRIQRLYRENRQDEALEKEQIIDKLISELIDLIIL